ncbi:ABC transporter ATP-binding protein [Acuticoccus sp. 2012]|uniref:ABC transporter ATP-binding protein n=1 Tax=Acuticoccus mangrovi TaxID=2796142 RepID=A0A934IQW0_9HYPH|nr:ABC transporter ATP-binding protein [Acuticoccus mangrovi]
MRLDPRSIDPPGARPNAGDPVLSVRHLNVEFSVPSRRGLLPRKVNVRAVNDLSFDIGRGETLALVGESGCGKSTTGRAILNLIPPSSGTVLFDGRNIAGLEERALRRTRARMQMIFQDPYGSLSPRQTIRSAVREALDVHDIGERAGRSAVVDTLLETCGIRPDLRDRYPHELSGGQRQRVGIARALATGPDLIVADEPTSALDVSIQAQILNLIRRLQRERQISFLFISHNMAVVRNVSARVAVMYLGSIVETGLTHEVLSLPLHPYTKALVSAVRVPDPAVERRRERIVLSGEQPSLMELPSGCPFHSRCWLRKQIPTSNRCADERPVPRTISPGRTVSCHFAEELG